MPKALIAKLTDILGHEAILTDVQSKIVYGTDLTTTFSPNPLAILLPNTLKEVVAIVNLAREYKVALVPSGGRTGYSGGAVANNQELVVSFYNMKRILECNTIDQTIRCEAGVTTKKIQQVATQHNLYYPIDFAAVDSCQIGGNIATNAGGVKWDIDITCFYAMNNDIRFCKAFTNHI